MRRRFFVEQFTGESAVIEGETAHHLGRVLRAEAGQLYELSDGRRAFLGRVESVERGRVSFALIEELPAVAPRCEITLLASVIKFDAFEWGLEKATELGVAKIVPLAAERSEKGLLTAAAKRAGRWRKILLESSQQCRRLSVPALDPLSSLQKAFATHDADLKLMLSECPDAPPLREVLCTAKKPCRTATIAIGPEGGWTDAELSAARSAGFRQASLGSLILRAETAVVAALAVLNFTVQD